MAIVVQKFGGTSIGNADRIANVIDIIKEYSSKYQLVIAVSAISRRLKTEGTTSLLLKLAENAYLNKDFSDIIKSIENVHLELIAELKLNETYSNQAISEVSKRLNYLQSFAEAISIIGELTSRSSDEILAYGEKLAAIIVSSALNNANIAAEYVSLANIVDIDFEFVENSFHNYCKNRISEKLTSVFPKIPVITGFIGRVPKGILKSIGRGYSDYTAAITAAALKAEELQIWKEVDGVFSADPNKVKQAYVIPSISPEEAAEITYYGSEVIHPFTIEQVIRSKIPVRIKNTTNPKLPGTMINPNASLNSQLDKPTAVTIKRNIQVINIKSNRMLMSHGFMAKIFNLLERFRIVIDLISTSEVSISLTFTDMVIPDALLEELEKIGEVSIVKNMAILSLVGHGMSKNIGTAGKMFKTLSESNINIEMISQGASEINISCVIKDEYADLALAAIHKNMLLV